MATRKHTFIHGLFWLIHMIIKIIAFFVLFCYQLTNLCSSRHIHKSDEKREHFIPWNQVPKLFRNLEEPIASNLKAGESKRSVDDPDVSTYSSFIYGDNYPNVMSNIKMFLGVLEKNGHKPIHWATSDPKDVTLPIPDYNMKKSLQNQGKTTENEIDVASVYYNIKRLETNNWNNSFLEYSTAITTFDNFTMAAVNDSIQKNGTNYGLAHQGSPLNALLHNESSFTGLQPCLRLHFTPLTTPWPIPSTGEMDPFNFTYRAHLNSDIRCHSKSDKPEAKNQKPYRREYMIQIPYQIILNDDQGKKKKNLLDV